MIDILQKYPFKIENEFHVHCSGPRFDGHRAQSHCTFLKIRFSNYIIICSVTKVWFRKVKVNSAFEQTEESFLIMTKKWRLSRFEPLTHQKSDRSPSIYNLHSTATLCTNMGHSNRNYRVKWKSWSRANNSYYNFLSLISSEKNLMTS